MILIQTNRHFEGWGRHNLAQPDEARRASAHVFHPFSYSLHTCKCIESNSPYK
jgi:hypothetical protein